jgi:hypothetical protein
LSSPHNVAESFPAGGDAAILNPPAPSCTNGNSHSVLTGDGDNNGDDDDGDGDKDDNGARTDVKGGRLFSNLAVNMLGSDYTRQEEEEEKKPSEEIQKGFQPRTTDKSAEN